MKGMDWQRRMHTDHVAAHAAPTTCIWQRRLIQPGVATQTTSMVKQLALSRMARRLTCFHGKGTMTQHSSTRFAHIHAPALPSCSQTTCCINVNKVNVDKAFCMRVNVHCMCVPCPRVSILRTCPASTCPCPAQTCAQVLLAHCCLVSFV